MSNNQTLPEWTTTSVDLSDNVTTVTASACLFRGATVTTDISAQDCPITDGTSNISGFAASSAVGTQVDGMAVRAAKLVVDPDDSATGVISVVWKPNHEGNVGS